MAEIAGAVYLHSEPAITGKVSKKEAIVSIKNYNKPPVMALAVPVAVKFLWNGNMELCRNMSSYLSLAAIAKADLLADHTEAITKSILQGCVNYASAAESLTTTSHPKHGASLWHGNMELCRNMSSYLSLAAIAKADLLADHTEAITKSILQDVRHHIVPTPWRTNTEKLRTIPSALSCLGCSATRSSVCRDLQLMLSNLLACFLGVLNKSVSSLISYLHDPNQNDSVLNILVEVSLSQPAAVASFLPNLKAVGDDLPNLLGQIAKIYGAVGRFDEERARSCLVYLVSLLASMEHTFHHTLLLEIKGITDTFSSILGAYSKDIYRMSNSFTAIAKLLVKKLESDNTPTDRTDDETEEAPKSCDLVSAISDGDGNEKLQVKIQAFEETLASENNSPGPIRRYSLGQTSKEERKEMRFNSVQKHLKEVRFFDFFGYSEEAGGWLCFMCNNPEKATGKSRFGDVRKCLKEQLQQGHFTKDDLNDSPIELSKVQSVKVVARKHRDRSLPRAFEIFTDNKTYVLKAKDEKNAEEWLQCINVAVAQAKERESREATTYL
ncbi:UNVERIFIED_CONTAM: hypothetical protein FKN15_036388 [Acipenser sinensis]